jgi:hypothetical protein
VASWWGVSGDEGYLVTSGLGVNGDSRKGRTGVGTELDVIFR